MKFAIIGCGYVSDHYMETLHLHSNLECVGVTDINAERADILAEAYQLNVIPTLEDVLNDPNIELVVNLTEPENHYEINKAALLAGKHVYSEKPLSVALDEAKELVELAERSSLVISSAPCSVLSETAQTLWKAVDDGAIGKPRLVYAELDDNPIYLMRPEGWRNARGIPWPYLNEYEVGCTLEHAGYYLTWLAAIFGPATSVTAFSSCLIPDKSPLRIEPPDTPDLSIGCIQFKSGVVARLTCSIVAPYDHRLKIIGDRGMLAVDECWQYGAPVKLERFSQMSLNARKSRTVRASSFLQWLFGVGGSKQKLVRKPVSRVREAFNDIRKGKRSLLGGLLRAIKKRELVAMDFFRGVADMADAIESGQKPLLAPDFVLHVNELTLALQAAGRTSAPYQLKTTFAPLSPLKTTQMTENSYGEYKPGILTGAIESAIGKLHKN